ncbi:MAG: hypothetical protein A2887_06705 [Alphaproteobacteria bacterium RIFCSPLOWO2_01_FULL_40_26]|nr:MAG: hypothetical protein A3D15_06395 [Alphaproteobacteria bacterium RIFCSPHIGHO2_02_FULL_40_34]OFW95398.1 MAG: hypothetical protein A2887_06705 [Alphaproteobacteria bacterium RIFCSPLOWO2_01_FULL_40_26]OFX10037.1 MAG: hypothetical protein A3H30_04420 [Alphaproteobacteria bacterium RIFCSPLOWO2_02_FULL_40_19]OFX11671.1 MAG: hypothetical protein A3G22_04015 [Alphaproteobacteria bacterium RIFCSPLOWO2_12_FULL_40_11]
MTKSNFISYLIAPAIALILVFLSFELWNIDLHLPIFSDGGDTLSATFVVKSVIDCGWFFSNDFVGLPHLVEKFYLHDFPLNADSFHFLLIKILSYFSSDHFLVMNLFFLLSFPMIAFSSFLVLRSFKISAYTAIIISILYSFLPYHLLRNVGHIFLSNYMSVPLAVMVALWIAENKIRLITISKIRQYAITPNRYFILASLISIFVATNGVYYAFYSCVIFVFAWFLHGLRNDKFFDCDFFSPFALCLLTGLTVILLNIPSFLYWFENGFNRVVAGRATAESEFYALRITDLFLPIGNHYVSYFRDLNKFFYNVVSGGERQMESLGILAASGFVFLLFWLIAKNHDGESMLWQKTVRQTSLPHDRKNLISNLASLNLLSVLFATAGGLVMFVAIFFPTFRSHARFVVFIAFFSFFLIAIVFDKIIASSRKKTLGKTLGKTLAQIVILFIAIAAFFDQRGYYSAETIQSETMKEKFSADRDFVAEIEQKLPKNAAVFMMPYIRFPEGQSYDMLIPYLHSKNLKWSQPAIIGRPSHLWQRKVSKMKFDKFISELKKVNFSGIYIDRNYMSQIQGQQVAEQFEKQLQKIAKLPPIISKNSNLVFYGF